MSHDPPGRCIDNDERLNLILTKNASPSHSVLGIVFGLSQLINCAARSVAPAFVRQVVFIEKLPTKKQHMLNVYFTSTLFAVSKQDNAFSENLVWYVMFSISLLGMVATAYVQDGAKIK